MTLDEFLAKYAALRARNVSLYGTHGYIHGLKTRAWVECTDNGEWLTAIEEIEQQSPQWHHYRNLEKEILALINETEAEIEALKQAHIRACFERQGLTHA